MAYTRNPNIYNTPLRQQPMNDRLDFLKTPSAPRKLCPIQPPRSSNRLPSPKTLNDRFQYIKVYHKQSAPNKKTSFVAMPTRQMWQAGYRPAWILRENKNPPEQYDVAINIYNNYLKTGQINFNENKQRSDRVKNIGSAYLSNLNHKH